MHSPACSTAIVGLMSVLLASATGCKPEEVDPDHGFACVEVYPSISQDDPVATFAGTMVVQLIFALTLMVETRGRSLEEVSSSLLRPAKVTS